MSRACGAALSAAQFMLSTNSLRSAPVGAGSIAAAGIAAMTKAKHCASRGHRSVMANQRPSILLPTTRRYPMLLFRRVFFLWLALAGTALAQPCPCPPAPPGPPPLWSGSAEISFLSTTGNTSTSSFGGALEVDYKPAPWALIFKTNYLRAESNDVTTAEQFGASVKGIRDLTPRIDVYAEGIYFRNRFAGIDSLVTGDGGAGYKILTGPAHTLRFELGVGYTHKDQAVGENRSYASGRAGIGYAWKFSKTASFTDDMSYTLDFSDSSNWIFANKAAVAAALTATFSLKASWTLLYNNEPVPTFKKTDTATAVALVAKF
jgi:putative salt-induced outer membrane protein